MSEQGSDDSYHHHPACLVARESGARGGFSRPWILVAGVAMGLLITVAGVFLLVRGERKESPWASLVLGPLIVVVLVYMLRKQDYSGYVVGRELVTPLSADWCPYCKSPLPRAATPRCPSCRVNILTK